MRGFWFTVEAVMAGIIIVSFLGFIAAVNLDVPEEDMTPAAQRILEGLDSQGLLKEYAAAWNYTAINGLVGIFAYNHTVEICSSNSCRGARPSGASNVWIGSYVSPGSSYYNPREVKLYVYR